VKKNDSHHFKTMLYSQAGGVTEKQSMEFLAGETSPSKHPKDA
jgi:hypothetical protein